MTADPDHDVRPARPAADDAPVLPSRSDDDRDVGWGDERPRERDDRDEQWYREQRPPHWE